MISTINRRFCRSADLGVTRSEDSKFATVSGYAGVYDNEYLVEMPPSNAIVYERIAPGAFKGAVEANPEMVFLFDHKGMPMASTRSNTLRVFEDERGLRFSAKLDMTDERSARLVDRISNGLVSEASFKFRFPTYHWAERSDGMMSATMVDMDIDRCDVSAVTFGANPLAKVNVGERSSTGVSDNVVPPLRRKKLGLRARLETQFFVL